MRTPFKIFLAIVGALFLLLAFVHPYTPLLAFGWIKYLERTLPNVRINWDAVALAVICSALVLIGVHSFGKLLLRHIKGASARWSWRATGLIYFSLWMLFAFTLAATGLYYQVAWQMASKEPFRIRDTFQFGQSFVIANLVGDSFGRGKEPPLATELYSSIHSNPELYSALEEERVFIFPDADGRVKYVVSVARNSKEKRFAVLSKDGFELYPLTKLPEFLKQSHL